MTQRTTLMVILLVLSGATLAAPGSREKVVSLGPVNGTINGNQVVEVTRSLPDPVLFEAVRSETPAMPDYLVMRSARAADRSDGSVALRQTRQTLTPAGQAATLSVEYRMRLWVDGKPAALAYRNQGEDVVISLPGGVQQVSLRSDGPVTLQMPKGYRGELSMVLETEGWQVTLFTGTP